MTFKGTVIKGSGIGKKLGFATANLNYAKCAKQGFAKAQEGVWVALTKVGRKTMPSVAFLGVAEMFGEKEKKLETHIFNFNKNLYGRRIQIKFLKKIRANKKFKTKKELISQMKKDGEKACEFFSLCSLNQRSISP